MQAGAVQENLETIQFLFSLLDGTHCETQDFRTEPNPVKRKALFCCVIPVQNRTYDLQLWPRLGRRPERRRPGGPASGRWRG